MEAIVGAIYEFILYIIIEILFEVILVGIYRLIKKGLRKLWNLLLGIIKFAKP